MICMYHLDDDGKCAAALVNLYGIKDSYPNQFIEMNYGYKIPLDKIATDEQVYIVDFSLDPKDMLALYEITANIVWIDHHISAISRYADFPHELDGIRLCDHSGCMLTYLYLTHQLDRLHDKELYLDPTIPMLVRLCDDYDMWRFNIPSTKAFHAGFDLIPHDPTEAIWADHVPANISKIIDTGYAIIAYRGNMMKELIKSYGYEATFEGHSCFVLNQGLISSDDFESIDVDKYDILVGYIFDGEMYSYSLRSKPSGPNVSIIAAKYGGGGHPPAAGFRSKELLIKKADS